MANNLKGIKISRRGFFKTSALVSMTATLPALTFPAVSLAGQSTISCTKPSPAGMKRDLLFMSDVPENYGKLLESIKNIKEYEINVIPLKVDFKKPKEILKSIQDKKPDIIFMRLPGIMSSSGSIAEDIGTLDVPVILLPLNYDLIMLEADLAATFRETGTNALLANSEEDAVRLIKIVAAPRVLEGKRALIFGKPFNSTSVPAHNLSEDYIFNNTGVRLEYRPLDDLKQIMEGADETAAKNEMKRWKKGATKIVEPTDDAILASSRLYIGLRSIIDKENLSGISIDCLSYSFGPDTSIPTPCLAFTRLRDEGVTATCEADVCMMLSSMLLYAISRRPSFVCNVSSVNTQASTTVLRHCVAPTKPLGADTSPLPYNLRDYHGMGRGVSAEMEFPVGLDITMGGFSKDLKNFVVWPGRIEPGIDDRATPSFKNAPPEMQKMRKFCSNRAEVKINDIHRFLQHIAGIHHIMVAGNYVKEINDSMLRMNMNVIAPSDLNMPEA